MVLAFQAPGQDEVLTPYVDRYLAAVDTTWERLGTHEGLDRAGVHLPAAAGLPRAAGQGGRVAGSLLGQPRRDPVRAGGRADVARYLAGQAKDAQG